MLTGHEPTTAERERLAYFFKLKRHRLQIRPDGTFDPHSVVPGAVPYEQQRFDELTAAHNAQLEAKLARDAYRGAVAGENYGGLGDDLMNLIGSYHSDAITFNDRSGHQATPAE